MNSATIASAVLTILTPFLAKAGEEVVKKSANAAWEKASEIYKAVKERISQEKGKHSKETLKRYEKEPEKQKRVMQKTLAEILDKDADFAKKLLKLVKAADKFGAGTVFNTNIYGGEVGEIINIETVHKGLKINEKK